MSFQRNGASTLGRFALIPNPDTARLVMDAIRQYGDVLQDGERVNVAVFVRLVCERIPTSDPLRDEYVRALKCTMESPADEDIGTGTLKYSTVRQIDRGTGAELTSMSGQRPASPHHH